MGATGASAGGWVAVAFLVLAQGGWMKIQFCRIKYALNKLRCIKHIYYELLLLYVFARVSPVSSTATTLYKFMFPKRVSLQFTATIHQVRMASYARMFASPSPGVLAHLVPWCVRYIVVWASFEAHPHSIRPTLCVGVVKTNISPTLHWIMLIFSLSIGPTNALLVLCAAQLLRARPLVTIIFRVAHRPSRRFCKCKHSISASIIHHGCTVPFRASTRCHACRCNIACKWTVMHKYAGTYLVSMMKCVTGAFLQSCEWAQDKLTERDVKLMISGRSGGSGTSETGKAERDN